MKLRALTIGITVKKLEGLQEAFHRAATVGYELRKEIEAAGLMEVQTVRVACNPFEEWFGAVDGNGSAGEEDLTRRIALLAKACEETDLEFINIGPATSVEGISLVPRLLQVSSKISTSAALATWREEGGANVDGDNEEQDQDQEELLAKIEEVIAAIAAIAEDPVSGGLGNFRFAAAFRIRPNTPFFPVAFHASGNNNPMAISIGLESSDQVVESFLKCCSPGQGLQQAAAHLEESLATRLLPLQTFVEQWVQTRNSGITTASENGGGGGQDEIVVYRGIDTSINPSLAECASLVTAYEVFVGRGRFGKSGTVAVSQTLTKVVREGLPGIVKVGYCGLMLPVMEDRGLSERVNQDPPTYGIAELIMNSSVCGVGLDTVPVSLKTVKEEPGRVKMLLLDIAALSRKLNKPLSCRIFPVPGARDVGDMTSFDSPYLCNCKIMAIP